MRIQGITGYSLFPVEQLIHGAHVRPYAICKELGIPLLYRLRQVPPRSALTSIAAKNTFLLFPGYTTNSADRILLFLSKLRRCRLVLDVADITYLQYYYFHAQPSSRSIRDFNELVNLSDILLFTTSLLRRQAARLMNLTGKQCEVVGNASDPAHFRFTELPDNNVIFYVGGYLPARGVDELIAAHRILRKRGIQCSLKIVSIGFPESFREEGVEVWRSLYYNQVPSLFAESYVFVIPHRPNLYMRMAAPLKLFDAMASGRPIVSTRCDETAAIIEQERCGVITGEDPKSIADAIEYLFENRVEARNMGHRARMAIEERYSWRKSAQKIVEILSKA